MRACVRAKIFLVPLGASVFLAGLVVYTLQVPAIIGTGCEEGGCSAYGTFLVPSVALSSLVIVVGLLVLAYALGRDESGE